MGPPDGLWRVIRPLQEGATAGWMRLYYEHLYQVSFVAQTVEDVAVSAIDHAYATFRPEFVAIALLEGAEWHVLPYRQQGTRTVPLRIADTRDLADATYEPGHIVEIPDVPAFTARFPRLAPAAGRGIRSLVCAAFGSFIHRRGYLAFSSNGEQHYSDDEFVLMCLHALAAGIGFDRVGAKPH